MRYALIGLALLTFPLYAVNVSSAPVTVLAPSQAYVLAPSEALLKNHPKKTESAPSDEVDVLMAIFKPGAQSAEDMDTPQFFAVMYYPPDFRPGKDQPELQNLLGDVEEIRYLDKKAWGANVSVGKPGLYQFIMEGKPWWDTANNRYIHEQAKVAVPVLHGARGWEAPFGQSFEILPLTRPFGLAAPALFSARIMMDGKPLERQPVLMGRVGDGKSGSAWSPAMEAISGADGTVSFVLNEPGWWYCQTSIEGDPLKGPDGEMRERLRSTIFWVYVESLHDSKSKNR